MIEYTGMILGMYENSQGNHTHLTLNLNKETMDVFPFFVSHISQMTKKGNTSTYNASVTQRIKGPHKSPTRKEKTENC